MVKSSSYYYL